MSYYYSYIRFFGLIPNLMCAPRFVRFVSYRNPIRLVDYIEYLFTLLSIMLGLGLTDLAKSFRELVRPGRTVHWHWLPSTWAAFTLLLVVNFWWNSIKLLKEAPLDFFLLFVITFLLVYLICSFALPNPNWQQSKTVREDASADAPASNALDLEAFYFSEDHRRWYFGLLIATFFMSELGLQAIAFVEGPGLSAESAVGRGAAIVLLIPLTTTKWWWVHAPVSILFLGEIAWTTIDIII